MGDPQDRYTIKYKDDVKRFYSHEEAITFVLSLPGSSDRIEIIKHGSWNKALIELNGEIGEIQRLVNIVLKWKEK